MLLPPPGMFSCPSTGLTPLRFLLRHYFAGERGGFLSILFLLLCLTNLPNTFHLKECIFNWHIHPSSVTLQTPQNVCISAALVYEPCCVPRCFGARLITLLSCSASSKAKSWPATTPPCPSLGNDTPPLCVFCILVKIMQNIALHGDATCLKSLQKHHSPPLVLHLTG